MSFEDCQAEILDRLVELGVPELLIDLSRHPELEGVNVFLRRKWNTAFLLSAIESLAGVSVQLTDPNLTQPLDLLATHEYVSRIITDADEALGELRKHDALRDASYFEQLLKPYRDLADELDTIVVAAEIVRLGTN
jgi:hypothetical protein